MALIGYNKEIYSIYVYRLQCNHCKTVADTLLKYGCSCGKVRLENGKYIGDPGIYKDVSIWVSDKGSILPQKVLDKYFLSRETNKTSTDTKTSTSASRCTH